MKGVMSLSVCPLDMGRASEQITPFVLEHKLGGGS